MVIMYELLQNLPSPVQGDSEKIPQHKNRNISEMCGNFCTNFRSFV